MYGLTNISDMNKTDPVITVEYALSVYGGNKAELARALGISRQSVNDWKNLEHVPPLQAHRLVAVNPKEFKAKSKAA